MRALVLVLLALTIAACSDDDRPTQSDAPATLSQEQESCANATGYFRTSSPPVVCPTIVYTQAVECDGHRCCDPNCEIPGQACLQDGVGFVPLTDDGFCESLALKLDLVECAAVRCQAIGCGGTFDEFFSGCARD